MSKPLAIFIKKFSNRPLPLFLKQWSMIIRTKEFSNYDIFGAQKTI